MNLSYHFKRINLSGFISQEPVIHATLIGKDNAKFNVTAILDTGSDFVLLPLEVAQLLNLEFDAEKKEVAKAYSDEPFTTTQSNVHIKIEKDRENIAFDCKCAVSLKKEAQHEYIIFGSSFLQNFKLLFDYPKNRFHIKH